MHPAHCAFRAPARKVRVSGRVPLKVRPCTQRNRRGPAPTLTGLIVRCRGNVKGPQSDAHPARPSNASVWTVALLSPFAFRFRLRFRFLLSLFRFCAQERAAVGSPLHCGGSGRDARRGGAMDRADSAACTWMCNRRNTGRGCVLFGQEPEKRNAWGAFLLVTFLCASKEK